MNTRITRRTLRKCTEALTGIGVRSGFDVTVKLCPAQSGEGLVLHRTDLDRRIPLHLDYALDLPNCSAVGTGPEDATLFVEHIMATLWAYGITDLVIECNGAEIPLLDGSARLWSEAVMVAGITMLEGEIETLTVCQPVRIEDNERSVEAIPAEMPEFSFDLFYENPLIGAEYAEFKLGKDRFHDALAPARTFALIEELEQAQATGMLKGGSEANCRIVYADHYSAPPTLPQEFARHKIVDMLGDLYLLGRPVIGLFKGVRTGHSHNRALLRKIAEIC